MPNPFVCCGRIQDPHQFVGRARELRAIFNALETAHTGQLQSVSIVGPRRMGRSSLLTHVTQTYPQRLSQPGRYVIRYIDLQSHALTADLPTLLAALLRELRAGLPASGEPATAALAAELELMGRAADVSLRDFETAIQHLHALPTPLYPVLCLDELEHLTQRPERFPADVYTSWRSLIDGNYLGLVIATAAPLHELSAQGRLTSPFFNIFSEYLSLGELEAAEAQTLLDWGRACDRPFSFEDCQRALSWAGRHPLKLQQAGSVIYHAKEEPRPNWRQARRAYEARMRQQFGEWTRREQMARGWRRLPEALGRLALIWRGEVSPETARLAGWLVLMLLAVGLALFGMSPAFRQWFVGLLPQGTPGP